jgi:MYXO-CTERM domain-containing protein
VKRSFLLGIAAAAAASAPVFFQAPAQAGCLPTDGTCTTFDPTTTSNPTGVGGFSGTFSPSGFQYSKARVQFAISGTFTPANFPITGIKITGNGITTELPLTLPLNVGFIGPGFDSNQTNFVDLNSLVSNLDFASSTISFSIPTLVASSGATISARIQYSDAGGTNINTTGTDFVTTVSDPGTPTPGPLPLLGAGAAFGFSRRLRSRVRLAA